MVKKIDKTASARPDLPAGPAGQPAGPVGEGIGAADLAGRHGRLRQGAGRPAKVFEALIKEGASLQRKTQSAAEEKIGEVTDRMSAMAGDVTAKAGQHWDKLESIFEQRTAKAMNKLGVPTAKDVDALIKRVDELAAAVARLSKAAPAKTATKAPAKTAAKPAAKAAAKKSTPRGAPRKTRS